MSRRVTRNISTWFTLALPVSFALAVLPLLLLPISPASADTRIGGSGSGPGGLSEGLLGLAVSQQQGAAVYVTDNNENQRVDEFRPDGEFVRAFGWGIIPGAATGSGDLNSGSPSVSNVLTSTGAFLPGQPITGSGIPAATTIVAVQPTGLLLSKPASATATDVALSVSAGPGNVAVNERQRVVVRATGGQFKLIFRSRRPASTTEATAPISATASAAQVAAALEALPSIGSGNVVVSGGPGDLEGSHPYIVEFTGRFADVDVRHLIPEDISLSGGIPSSAINVTTLREGAGALETCTTVCAEANHGEGEDESAGEGAEPGEFDRPDEIAIDNSCAEHEPPLSGSTTPTCAEFDPSYGDLYVVDQRNFRVEKYSPSGQFLLMFGGEVDKTSGANRCTSADLAAGDICGSGVPGTGPTHFYAENPTQPTGRPSWFWEGSNSIAIGPDGTVYVGDYGRVQEFNEAGEFEGELDLGEAEPKNFAAALAVDSAGDLYERSVDYSGGGVGQKPILSEVPGIREYSPAHALIRSFDAGPEEAGSEPTHIALDQQGDLFATDFNNGNFTFRAFKPGGQLYAEFTSPQVQLFGPQTTPNNPGGLAIGASDLYVSAHAPEGGHIAVIPVPTEGPPLISEELSSDVRPTTATLHGVVNPREFDTHYRFQYLTQAKYEEDGNSFGPGTLETPQPPADLGSLWRKDPVQAALSGLTPDTQYRWRILAESSQSPSGGTAGPVEEFTTLPAVSVLDFTTQTVGPELVTIKAELNPNNSLTKTHWKICLGKDTSYSNGCSEGELPAGSGTFEAIEATFTSLQPNTPYHYRLVAEDFYTSPGHLVETDDREFTTEPSATEERTAEDCPANGSVHGAPGGSTLREENHSTALPDCRAYEQVSPQDKNGGKVSVPMLAPSGERAGFGSAVPFSGAASNGLYDYYTARRGKSGDWTTLAMLSHTSPFGWEPEVFPPGRGGAGILSADLSKTLYLESPGFNGGDLEGSLMPSNVYLSLGFADGSNPLRVVHLALAEGEPSPAGNWAKPAVTSEDMSRFFIFTSRKLLPSDPRPDERGDDYTRIYEVAGAGGPSPTLALVAEVPLGLREENVSAGDCDLVHRHQTEGSTFFPARLASADGTELVFTMPIERSPGAPCGVGTPNPLGLYLASLGQTPVQLNVVPPSQCTAPSPCSSGTVDSPRLYGISPDGTSVWFTTDQPLINSDRDEANDLYLAKIAGGRLDHLVLASGGDQTDPAPGENARVLGITGISQDASRVAFVATGILTAIPNAQGEAAEQGADNLYVFDRETEATHFVAHLCSGPEKSGPEQSGFVVDPQCPRTLDSIISGNNNNDGKLWLPDAGYSSGPKFSLSDRYLLFASLGRLTADDTDNAEDLYRYDFQTGQLLRISKSSHGNDGNGNDDKFPAGVFSTDAGGSPHWPAQLADDTDRPISSDGSVVVFQSDAPLVSRDTDRGTDVYEWEEEGAGTCREAGGCIFLISSGTVAATNPVLSESGRDIVFNTAAALAPGDTDGVADVYDARINGGFPFVSPPKPCGGAESCHGEGTAGALQVNPITEANQSGGNGKNQLQCAKGKHKVKKHGQWRCVAVHRRHHHHKRRARRAGLDRGGSR